MSRLTRTVHAVLVALLCILLPLSGHAGPPQGLVGTLERMLGVKSASVTDALILRRFAVLKGSSTQLPSYEQRALIKSLLKDDVGRSLELRLKAASLGIPESTVDDAYTAVIMNPEAFRGAPQAYVEASVRRSFWRLAAKDGRRGLVRAPRDYHEMRNAFLNVDTPTVAGVLSDGSTVAVTEGLILSRNQARRLRNALKKLVNEPENVDLFILTRQGYTHTEAASLLGLDDLTHEALRARTPRVGKRIEEFMPGGAKKEAPRDAVEYEERIEQTLRALEKAASTSRAAPPLGR